jgi:cytochrome b561
MANSQERSLIPAAKLARFALIGVVMLIVAGAFAYAGGWLSPGRLTPARMIGAFEPQDAALYAWLRQLHTILAYLFFATFLTHLGAALLRPDSA